MIKKIILSVLLLKLFISLSVHANTLKEINISGNDRIPDETISMFSGVKLNDKINDFKIDEILKNLYKTNFFDDVSVLFEKNILVIKVKERPIIDSVVIEGITAKKYNKAILENLKLKSRSSYNEYLLFEETKNLKSILKNFGFYFAKVEPYVEKLPNNLIKIVYKIELGDKSKIKKISFVGDKIFKDRKLKNVVVSEEYKFWKFLSNRKFLNEDIENLDKRLLKNFYLNKGYYNVEINSSFAKMINDDEFELIYNINAGSKVYFNELSISYPEDFNEINYQKLNELLVNLNGKPYSINSVEKILNQIDQITINEEFKSISANIDEKIYEDKIDIKFIIKETESYVVERINIFGNNVTRESVIRNQLIIDEGDPFNEILAKKSENNLKSLNFFKSVKSEIVEGEIEKSKIINIYVEEKPTGEIAAGAGVGTSGGTISAGVKENNYLGKGLAVEANATITPETIKGLFSISNPNYNNSDKLVFFNAQAIEIDRLKNNGYKTNKTGFELGAEFEYLDDLSFGIATSNFFETIETNATASTRQKAQKGNYFDAFVKFDFFYDKRNQKFRPTDGFYSKYDLDVPLISDNNTLTNSYDLKFFNELYENNVTTFSILLKAANSIAGDDIKLTERLIIPSSRLRGFEPGKVGPKDGKDFIGGNYVTAINLNTTLPQILPNMQNLDSSIFIDAANIWGVDYDSSLSDTNKIRSSIGIGIDWFTILGPLSFSLSEVITKEDSDVEESFRFRLGTTF